MCMHPDCIIDLLIHITANLISARFLFSSLILYETIDSLINIIIYSWIPFLHSEFCLRTRISCQPETGLRELWVSHCDKIPACLYCSFACQIYNDVSICLSHCLGNPIPANRNVGHRTKHMTTLVINSLITNWNFEVVVRTYELYVDKRWVVSWS